MCVGAKLCRAVVLHELSLRPLHCSVKSALNAAGNATTPLLWGVSNLGQEHTSKNNVYTLFASHLPLFTAIGCLRFWLEGIQLRPEINNEIHFLSIRLLMSTPTPTLNLPLTRMKKIVIIVIQCDKNCAVSMCACPVAPYVSLRCRPAFFARYLHKFEECTNFWPLSTLHRNEFPLRCALYMPV